MKYFPAETITYKTKLCKDEVLERIKKEITPKYLHQTHTERFKGTIAGDTFSLKQVNTRSTSFLPTIWGSVSEIDSGTTVTLSITLTQFIQGFAGFVIIIIAIQSVLAATQIRSFKDIGITLVILAFSAAFVFGLLRLIVIGFNTETRKIYSDFFILLDAESFEKK